MSTSSVSNECQKCIRCLVEGLEGIQKITDVVLHVAGNTYCERLEASFKRLNFPTLPLETKNASWACPI